MAMSAKFLITIAFDAAYLITYEICPTTLRCVIFVKVRFSLNPLSSVQRGYIIQRDGEVRNTATTDIAKC